MPGNHDICRADRTCDPLITRLEAEKEYRAFLCRLYGGNGFHSRRHLGYCHVLSTREDPPRPAVVLSLNSCRIETSFTPGLGWVGYDQIFKLIARLPNGA
jgi:hypothetical protein